MKASMKKSLLAMHTMLEAQVKQTAELIQQEEDYSCDLEDETKREESESRQEALSELETLLEGAVETLKDLLA